MNFEMMEYNWEESNQKLQIVITLNVISLIFRNGYAGEFDYRDIFYFTSTYYENWTSSAQLFVSWY